jgi:hypothetical protein
MLADQCSLLSKYQETPATSQVIKRMADKAVIPQSSANQQSLLVPGATKKPPKQQQKGHQQSSEHSQQKGPRVDPKVSAGSNQSSRPAAVGSAGQNNRQQDHPAGAPRAQQTQRTVPKVSIRLSLFDHLPRKQVVSNPHSIEGDISLHPATVKLGKNRLRLRFWPSITINFQYFCSNVTICYRIIIQEWISAIR